MLKEINLIIKEGAKIGVAGRTGAGKSSFVAALMRMPVARWRHSDSVEFQ